MGAAWPFPPRASGWNFRVNGGMLPCSPCSSSQSDHTMVAWLLSLNASYIVGVLSNDCDLAYSGALQADAIVLVRMMTQPVALLVIHLSSTTPPRHQCLSPSRPPPPPPAPAPPPLTHTLCLSATPVAPQCPPSQLPRAVLRKLEHSAVCKGTNKHSAPSRDASECMGACC